MTKACPVCADPVPRTPASAVFCDWHWTLMSPELRQWVAGYWGTGEWVEVVQAASRAVARLEHAEAAVRQLADPDDPLPW